MSLKCCRKTDNTTLALFPVAQQSWACPIVILHSLCKGTEKVSHFWAVLTGLNYSKARSQDLHSFSKD